MSTIEHSNTTWKWEKKTRRCVSCRFRGFYEEVWYPEYVNGATSKMTELINGEVVAAGHLLPLYAGLYEDLVSVLELLALSHLRQCPPGVVKFEMDRDGIRVFFKDNTDKDTPIRAILSIGWREQNIVEDILATVAATFIFNCLWPLMMIASDSNLQSLWTYRFMWSLRR